MAALAERGENGAVKLAIVGWDITLRRELTADQWAQLVAAVSEVGDNGRQRLIAKSFHEAGDVVLPPADEQRMLVVHGECPTDILVELGTAAGCDVVQLPEGVELKAMNEEAMNQMGWFRFDLTSEDVGQ